MMPVRWLTNGSHTRYSACKSSCAAVSVATNFIVGRCPASLLLDFAAPGQPLLLVGPEQGPTIPLAAMISDAKHRRFSCFSERACPRFRAPPQCGRESRSGTVG